MDELEAAQALALLARQQPARDRRAARHARAPLLVLEALDLPLARAVQAPRAHEGQDLLELRVVEPDAVVAADVDDDPRPRGVVAPVHQVAALDAGEVAQLVLARSTAGGPARRRAREAAHD